MNLNNYIIPLLILASFFLVPYGSLKSIYSFDSGQYRVAKAINIINVMILTLVIFPGITFSFIFNFPSFKDIYAVDTGMISANLNLIAAIALQLLGLYLIIVLFGLTRRVRKDRIRFIYSLPFIAVLWTFRVYRVGYTSGHFGDDPRDEGIIYLILAMNLLYVIVLFFIYNSKAFKNMMSLTFKQVSSNDFGSA